MLNKTATTIEKCMAVLNAIKPVNKDVYDNFDSNTWCTAGLDADGDLVIRVMINSEEYQRIILSPGTFKTDGEMITQARDLVTKIFVEYEINANSDNTRTFREMLRQDVRSGCMSEEDMVIISKMALNGVDINNLLTIRAHTIHDHFSNLNKLSMLY